MKIGDDNAARHPFGLVYRNNHRTIELAQFVGNFLVERRNTRPPIHDENNGIGLGNGLLGLARHLVHDAFLGKRFETAGINDEIGLAANLAMTVVSIARQAGYIGNERIARLGQAVE